MKQTNYLNFDRFYEFEDWLVRLESFHSDEIIPPMSANEFYWMARTQLTIGGVQVVYCLLMMVKDGR